MLKTLQLILPAWIPSWRFFDEIAPSPRIEYALLSTSDEKPTNWQSFRPRPEHVSTARMFKRMLWNPNWNDTLFTASCAERLMASPETLEHSTREIMDRIRSDLHKMGHDTVTHPYFQFRLAFIYRSGSEIQHVITHHSEIESVTS